MRVGPERGECRPEAALVTSRGTTAQASGPYLELVTPARRLDAASLLTCYLFLLMAIPSSLVFGSFGAAGAPAARRLVTRWGCCR